MADSIRNVEVERDARGMVQCMRFAFGPHYFVEVDQEDGRVRIAIGATHHGIRVDASEVGGEFERVIDALKRAHPNAAF